MVNMGELGELRELGDSLRTDLSPTVVHDHRETRSLSVTTSPVTTLHGCCRQPTPNTSPPSTRVHGCATFTAVPTPPREMLHET